jgi:hypothetical protein
MMQEKKQDNGKQSKTSSCLVLFCVVVLVCLVLSWLVLACLDRDRDRETITKDNDDAKQIQFFRDRDKDSDNKPQNNYKTRQARDRTSTRQANLYVCLYLSSLLSRHDKACRFLSNAVLFICLGSRGRTKQDEARQFEDKTLKREKGGGGGC